MSAIDNEPFPRGALIAAGLVVATALTITAGARFLPGAQPHLSADLHFGPPAQTIALNFFDERDGSVLVKDSRDARVITVLAPGTNGFVRGVMRGLARDRMMRRIGAAPPFMLMRWSDGRLALRDSATGRTIDLDAFGGTNKAAFEDLLTRDAGA